MDERAVVDGLERLVVAGVALTTRSLSTARADLDLTLAQWRVLVVLGDAADGATISQVAGRIGVTLQLPAVNCAASPGEVWWRSVGMRAIAGRCACD